MKFGGYDQEAYVGEMKYLRTRSNKTWEVELDNAKIGDLAIDLSPMTRFVHLELAYPYIYVPQTDFSKISKAINDKYGISICNAKANRCFYNQPCSKIPNLGK